MVLQIAGIVARNHHNTSRHTAIQEEFCEKSGIRCSVRSTDQNKTMEILGPELKANSTGESANAVVVIGTVEGDVHDIGKSICSTMLQCGGFEIHDLGRDVPKQQFIDEIKNGAKFCGMSALMTSTMMVMKDTIDVLKEQNLRDQVVVMVGGAPITQVFSDKIGADIYGESASETTEKAKAWLNKQ